MRALILLTTLLLAGCAGRTVLLRNASGDLQKCEVTTTGAVMGGVIARDMAINQCVKEYQAAGYSRVSPP